MKSNIINNYKPDIDSFYKNFYNINFENISDNNMMRFKESSKTLNRFYEYKNTPYTKLRKYIMLMNKIKTNPKGFGIYDNKLILIERNFIKYILDPKNKKEIQDRIDDAIYR